MQGSKGLQPRMRLSVKPVWKGESKKKKKKGVGETSAQGSFEEGQGRPQPYCTGPSSAAVGVQADPSWKSGYHAHSTRPHMPHATGKTWQDPQAEVAPTGKRESPDFRNAPAEGDEWQIQDLGPEAGVPVLQPVQ